ncbi:hypothetical protein FRC17_008501, partial [Serendipita sp. 399]
MGRKRSRAASSGSEERGRDMEVDEVDLKKGRQKRARLDAMEEDKGGREGTLDWKKEDQGDYKGKENDGELGQTLKEEEVVVAALAGEIARLVCQLMQELCQRRLDGMWSSENDERGGDGSGSVLELATRYVMGERALLQACLSSWQELEKDLERR